jgi:rod shape-determining protein MreC
MKFLRSKFFILSAAVAIVLALTASALAVFGRADLLRSAIGSIAKPFSWCGTQVANAINGFTDVFTEYDRLKEENAALKGELEAIKKEKYSYEVIKEENSWLKQYLSIKTDNPAFILSDAEVISREAGNYSTVLMLNRGTIHGIKRGMPVITYDGVLGHVTEVGLDFCKVTSIIESSSSVGVYVDRSKVQGVVKGDVELRSQGLCTMTYNAGSDVKVGDRVYTSGGSGSYYPDGLLLGEIISISADEATRTLVATIKTSVDLTEENIPDRVMIICGYER